MIFIDTRLNFMFYFRLILCWLLSDWLAGIVELQIMSKVPTKDYIWTILFLLLIFLLVVTNANGLDVQIQWDNIL